MHGATRGVLDSRVKSPHLGTSLQVRWGMSSSMMKMLMYWNHAKNFKEFFHCPLNSLDFRTTPKQEFFIRIGNHYNWEPAHKLHGHAPFSAGISTFWNQLTNYQGIGPFPTEIFTFWEPYQRLLGARFIRSRNLYILEPLHKS